METNMKLDNKGQALVIFIILIPVIILVFGIVIDIGSMGGQKRKIVNVVKDSIEYTLNHDSSEPEIKKTIDKNIKYEDIKIEIDKSVKVTLTYKYQTIFGFIKKNKLKITYLGYKEDNQIKIMEG